MRLDKFLSNLKYNSRSNITKDIKNGFVKVDSKIITDNHYRIDPNKNIVHYKDELVIYRDIVNLLIYKPKGYLSANIDNMHPVVIDLLKEPYTRFDFKIAGRLDLDSEGLLILTTSGSFVNEVTNPNKKVLKHYLVETSDNITNYLNLLNGVIIKDGKGQDYLAKAISINKINDYHFEIVIDEGKFHQVKRMFIALGTKVINLKRTQIGNIKLGNLKPGEYIEFKKEEL